MAYLLGGLAGGLLAGFGSWLAGLTWMLMLWRVALWAGIFAWVVGREARERPTRQKGKSRGAQVIGSALTVAIGILIL